MGLQVQSIACDRDIHESFMIEEILEDGKEIVLVVVPAETVLLWLAGGGDSHGSADASRASISSQTCNTNKILVLASNLQWTEHQ